MLFRSNRGNEFMFDDLNGFNRYHKNRLMCQMISKAYNFKLYDIDWVYLDGEWAKLPTLFPHGRDLHFGQEGHADIARRFLELTNDTQQI